MRAPRSQAGTATATGRLAHAQTVRRRNGRHPAPLVRLTLNRRDGFLQAVAAALASHPGEVGPGVVHRVCAEVQRQHFDPPDFSHAGSVSKFR